MISELPKKMQCISWLCPLNIAPHENLFFSCSKSRRFLCTWKSPCGLSLAIPPWEWPASSAVEHKTVCNIRVVGWVQHWVPYKWWGDPVQLLTLTLLHSPFLMGEERKVKTRQWKQRSGDHLPLPSQGIRLDLGKVNLVYNSVGWQEAKRKAETLSPTLFPRLNLILCRPHICTGPPETYTGIVYKVKKIFLWQCSCIRRREIEVSGNPWFHLRVIQSVLFS